MAIGAQKELNPFSQLAIYPFPQFALIFCHDYLHIVNNWFYSTGRWWYFAVGQLSSFNLKKSCFCCVHSTIQVSRYSSIRVVKIVLLNPNTVSCIPSLRLWPLSKHNSHYSPIRKRSDFVCFHKMKPESFSLSSFDWPLHH